MKLTVCIGSSCHLKGARQVVQQLQQLIEQHQLENTVEMAGAFCMGNCQNGVCTQWNDTFYSLSADTVDSFFENEVLTKVPHL